MKLPDDLETSSVVECKVPGCGWRAEVPVLYRFQSVPGSSMGRLVVDREAVDAFDAYVAGHLAQHEVAETVLEHDDPGPAE